MTDVGSCCFLSFVLLVSSAKGFQVHGPAEPIVTQVSARVVLPCFVDSSLPVKELGVEWRRTDTEAIVHLFQEGDSRPESQDPSYMDRAQFFTQEISKGNFSLLLENITTKDEGTYKCLVYTNLGKNETLVEINIGGLLVKGADKPVYAHAGEVVVLQCSVDTSRPVEKLQVEWIKTENEILLYSAGRFDRLWDRAEFFTEEIPKGNFSMKLRNFKIQDKGEYVCNVHTDTGSANVTVQVKDLGFSALRTSVLVVSLAVTPVLIMTCLQLWFCLSDLSYDLYVILPSLTMALATILMGVAEGFISEALTCTSVNLMRAVVLYFMDSPHFSFPGKGFPMEYLVIVTGALAVSFSDFLTKYSPTTNEKVVLGFILFSVSVLNILALFLQGPFFLMLSGALYVIFTALTERVLRLDYLVLLLVTAVGTGVFWVRNERFYLYKKICIGIFFILQVTFGFLYLDVALENDKERTAKMCLSAFLYTLIFASWFRGYWRLRGMDFCVLLFGTVVLPVVDSIALAVEVVQTANTGERTIDLRLIVLPFDSILLFGWFSINLYKYCAWKNNKINEALPYTVQRCCTDSPPNELQAPAAIPVMLPLSSSPQNGTDTGGCNPPGDGFSQI